MTSLPLRLRSLRTFVRLVAALCLAPLLFGRDSSAGSPLSVSRSVKVATVTGSATNTVTSLVFLNDTTILIESEQVGHLTQFGSFTGHFSYVAFASPAGFLLLGSATLTNEEGEKLFLAANIVETGTDYPYAVNGTLTVLGGTGHYAGATGSIALTGTDEASLTDTFQLNGTLVTVH